MWGDALRGSQQQGLPAYLDPALELCATVASLLAQFPESGLLGRLCLVDEAGGELDADRGDGRAVLEDDGDREWSRRVLD